MSTRDDIDRLSRETKSNPFAWIEHGNMLLQAATWTINTPLSRFMREDPPDIRRFTGIEAASMQRRNARTHIYRLLLGSALECFLKAHTKNCDEETHDCVSLARGIDIELTSAEEGLIAELSIFAVTGRYPFVSNRQFRRINSRPRKAEPSKSARGVVTGHFVQYGFIDAKDAETEIALVRELRERVKKIINYTAAPVIK